MIKIRFVSDTLGSDPPGVDQNADCSVYQNDEGEDETCEIEGVPDCDWDCHIIETLAFHYDSSRAREETTEAGFRLVVWAAAIINMYYRFVFRTF